MIDFKHVSVLYQESIDGLAIKPDGIYVDGTLGGGGHARGILEELTTGRLIGIDQDEDALSTTTQKLSSYAEKFVPYRANFSQLESVLEDLGIVRIDGILLDLGVSSHQLDTPERGFSYQHDAPLDMRMDQSDDLTAYQIVNYYSKEELHHIIKTYGEERWAKRIASFIIQQRSVSSIDTTFDLVEVIKKAIPKKVRSDGPHPARRTFQAIRIAVNRELEIIEQTINDATYRLNKNGRIAIITFHSLEDRIVKHTYKELAKDCICPPQVPLCTCDKKAQIKIITRKPILPSELEIGENSRSRSAKLRVAERI